MRAGYAGSRMSRAFTSGGRSAFGLSLRAACLRLWRRKKITNAATMTAATMPPTAIPTIAGVWMDEDEDGGGVACVALFVFEGALRVLAGPPPGRIGFSVVVMTWVTGGRFVMISVEVTSIVVLALMTL